MRIGTFTAMTRGTLARAAALLLATACPDQATAQSPPAKPAAPAAKAAQITPLEAMKMCAQRGDFAKVRQIAIADLWNDISKPETLQQLVMACQKIGDREQAGVYCHILLTVLAQKTTAAAPSTPAIKKWAEAQLPTLDVDFKKAQKQHLDAAAGKKFTAPEQVSDLWMTQVTSDAHNLHGLYAWTLVGGRKDAKPDWIHNRQGVMHRSCMKLCGDVEGRKGILYSIPVKAPTDATAGPFNKAIIERLGRLPQITMPNVGKCRFFRAGLRAYGFPFIARVLVGGKELLSQRVEITAWTDLKVDLGDAVAKGTPVVVELIVPEGQKYNEGAWIDYMDFFDD